MQSHTFNFNIYCLCWLKTIFFHPVSKISLSLVIAVCLVHKGDIKFYWHTDLEPVSILSAFFHLDRAMSA